MRNHRVGIRIWRLVSFSCALILATTWIPAQSVPSSSDKASTVLSLENAWNAAEVRHDAKALNLLLADSFVYTDVDGSFKDRQKWLQDVRDVADDYSTLTNESQSAHVYGNTVIVTGIYREKVKRNGKIVLRRGRFTDTWIFEGHRWNCVASQATLIAPWEPADSHSN